MKPFCRKRTENAAPVRFLALLLALSAPAWAAACGSPDPGSAASKTELKQAVSGAPRPLARLYAKGDVLLNGGTAAYRRQIASLEGYPIVVNKWASWCGPCRHELPFFQRQVEKRGKQVAFLGVDSEDGREPARKFLDEFPVPYPSFFDPNSEIATVFRGQRAFPATAFYDVAGELVYTKPGGYASESALSKDIRQYALAGAKAPQREQVQPSDLQ